MHEPGAIRDEEIESALEAIERAHEVVGAETGGDETGARQQTGQRRLGVERRVGELKFEKFLSFDFERAGFVKVVEFERQQVLVFRVSDEQQAEQNHRRHLIGLGEVLCGGLAQAACNGESFGKSRDDGAVNALAQTMGEITGKTVGLLKQRSERAALRQRLGGKQKPEESGVGIAQETRVDFDISFSASAPADADADLRGVEAQFRALGDEDVRNVFAVGHGQRVGDRGKPAEARRGQFRGFVLPKQDSDGGFPFVGARAQDRRDLIHGLDFKSERVEQSVALALQERTRLAFGVRPRIEPARADSKLVRREKTFIAQPRQSGVHRWKCIAQPA